MEGVEFSDAALLDLEQIDDDTIERFGLAQAEKLRERFHEILNHLVAFPLSAPRRPEYDPGGKSFRYFPAAQRFVIVYEPGAEGIRVARVLHDARDLTRELARESG